MLKMAMSRRFPLVVIHRRPLQIVFTQPRPKAVAEFWLNMGENAWSSLDVNWTSAYETYAGRVRSGYRVFETLSLGLEARVNGNELDKDARGGLFVRYEWTGGEISLAGGIAGHFFDDANSETEPYAAITWLMQY